MHRFEAHGGFLPPALLPRYAAAVRRWKSREDRFPASVLLAFALHGEAPLSLKAEGDEAEILLYDEIGYWGVTAKEFVLALAQCGGRPVHLRINSPGGDTFDGLAIYNALRGYGAPVQVTVDGIAASAASIIAMAGQPVEMPEASMLMIHNCWGLCVGNRNDLRDMADVMQKIDGQMAGVYAQKCGRAVDELGAMMDAETYFTAAEAKATGLCDLVLPPANARAAGGFTPAVRGCARTTARLRAAALPAYDPDGDGDNDAEEALGFINSAIALLSDAAEALTGAEEDGDASGDSGQPEMPMVPGATQMAATASEWVVGAAEDLPIDTSDTWDGPAAAEHMLDDAGFNGNSPDPAKAKRGFLTWDHHNPNLKGSYKLPFADLVGGQLKAVKGGIDAAAARLPQTDIPADVKQRARDVLDAYEARMSKAASALAQARARQLQSEAEAAA